MTVDPDKLPARAVEAARKEWLAAKRELEYFGASEDFTRSPLEAALAAFTKALVTDNRVVDRAALGIANREAAMYGHPTSDDLDRFVGADAYRRTAFTALIKAVQEDR